MAIHVCPINVVIVVLPIPGTGVIRRIYVDTVNLALVHFLEKIKRLQIITFNDEVPGQRSVLTKTALWIGCKYGNILLQKVIHFFGVLLPDKAVFLVTDMILYLVEGLDGGVVGVGLLEALQEGYHLVSFYFGQVGHMANQNIMDINF